MNSLCTRYDFLDYGWEHSFDTTGEYDEYDINSKIPEQDEICEQANDEYDPKPILTLFPLLSYSAWFSNLKPGINQNPKILNKNNQTFCYYNFPQTKKGQGIRKKAKKIRQIIHSTQTNFKNSKKNRKFLLPLDILFIILYYSNISTIWNFISCAKFLLFSSHSLIKPIRTWCYLFATFKPSLLNYGMPPLFIHYSQLEYFPLVKDKKTQPIGITWILGNNDIKENDRRFTNNFKDLYDYRFPSFSHLHYRLFPSFSHLHYHFPSFSRFNYSRYNYLEEDKFEIYYCVPKKDLAKKSGTKDLRDVLSGPFFALIKTTSKRKPYLRPPKTKQTRVKISRDFDDLIRCGLNTRNF